MENLDVKLISGKKSRRYGVGSGGRGQTLTWRRQGRPAPAGAGAGAGGGGAPGGTAGGGGGGGGGARGGGGGGGGHRALSSGQRDLASDGTGREAGGCFPAPRLTLAPLHPQRRGGGRETG